MKLISIIQARTSSKRLENKVLKKINKKPIIEYVYESALNSKLFDDIIIATSNKKSDHAIAEWCKEKNIKCFRGSLNDVSSRFYKICKNQKFDYFMRVCADSPLLDFKILKKKIKFIKNCDLFTNCLDKTFPKGQSIEIISKKVFMKNVKNFQKRHKEHITSFFYENHEKFSIKNFVSREDLSQINLSIDTINDFYKIKKILNQLKNKHFNYSYKKYISLY
jgi:spore coat polysaccharide biosynthesis protein SpsF (cytidylyltransferase family)